MVTSLVLMVRLRVTSLVLVAKHITFFLGGHMSHPKATPFGTPLDAVHWAAKAPLAFRVFAHGHDWMAPHMVPLFIGFNGI